MKTKNDFIVWIIIFILIGLFLWQLPNIYDMVFSKEPKKEVKKEETVLNIPSNYNCSLIDNSTDEEGYTTVQKVKFNIDQSGNVKDGTLDVEYKFMDSILYENEKNLSPLSDNIEIEVNSDDVNKIIKYDVKIDYKNFKKIEGSNLIVEMINGFPTEYKKLEKYLSNHLYSCTKN